MSKVNNIIGSRSVSSTSCNSLVSDIEETIDNGLDDLTLTKSNRPSSTTRTTKAKRIRFYHNGNKYFGGVVVPVASDRYRSFDSLTTELTNLLMKTVTLPSGVRTIFSMDGRKISSLEELEDGKEYVCSGKGELFKKIDYTKTEALKNKRASVSKPTVPVSRVVLEDCVRPRIVTIIRNGIKPRKKINRKLNID